VPADIQVIDEVLGVGDAYFFGKCLQRFRKFQEEGRTTVLVSHDHGMVLRLCSRCIWIEQGEIVADGTPLEVITAYLHSVAEEHDRHVASRRIDAEMPPTSSDGLRARRAIRIEEVEIFGEAGLPAQHFSMRQRLTVRIAYSSDVALNDAVVSVTVYRVDGVTVCNAISSMDGASLTFVRGRGAIEAVFDPLMLGPGEYTLVVGIYPSLDLSDYGSPQHAVLWHRSRTFTVCQPVGVAMDLGVIRHPVKWQLIDRPPLQAGNSVSGEAALREDTKALPIPD
ncbi:MAG: Wzt carbohydrate-binding domain-containing protein, partial [Nitrospiraceae bacterium]